MAVIAELPVQGFIQEAFNDVVSLTPDPAKARRFESESTARTYLAQHAAVLVALVGGVRLHERP
jgi:hypothetical protein